jgi:hypothetical protein
MLKAHYSDVLKDNEPPELAETLPIVYSSLYNISFFGLEKLHPMDSCKFAKIVSSLKQQELLIKVWWAGISMHYTYDARINP